MVIILNFKRILIIALFLYLVVDSFLVYSLLVKTEYTKTDFKEKIIVINQIKENNDGSEYLLYDNEGYIYSTWQYNMLKEKDLRDIIKKNEVIKVYYFETDLVDSYEMKEIYIYGLKKDDAEIIYLQDSIEELNSNTPLCFGIVFCLFCTFILVYGIRIRNKIGAADDDDIVFDFRFRSK